MTIKYFPDDLLRKLAPEKKIKKLVKDKSLTLNRTVLSMFDGAEFISKSDLTTVCLKTIKKYKEKFKDLKADGESSRAAKKSALNDKKLLVQRVQNAIVWQVSDQIKSEYRGERYRWLPSDAEEPRADHQLNYGKVFVVGEGEMPGEEPGCKCGMEILVKEDSLKL